MDPVTIGAVLLAIVSGAGEGLGKQLWEGVVSLVRRPFRRKETASGDAGSAVVPRGEAELAALQQVPDQHNAVNVAEALLARSGADGEFRRALESWWQQAEPIRASVGNVTNSISGGTQHGPVLQGRDFSNLSFGASPTAPQVPPATQTSPPVSPF
jgi:hypothetical protein